MARVIARVSGVALRPGISKNNRLYSRPAIAKMVARAQERIAAGDGPAFTDRFADSAAEPLSQRTHHLAQDDSTRIVGRLTGMSLDEDGAARFTADIADTQHGRTIAALLDTSDGQPAFLRNVSIRGGWVGNVRTYPDKAGETLTTADDLTLDGLDYTASPGVPGAQVDSFQWAGPGLAPGESEDGRVLICESITEAHVTAITEETQVAEVAAAQPPAATETAPAPESPPGLVIGEALAADLRGVLRAALPAVEPAHAYRDGECVTCEAATPMSQRTPGLGGTGGPYADPGYQDDKKARYQLDTKDHAVAAWRFIGQAKNAKFYTAAQLKRIKGRIIKALRKFGVSVTAEGWVIEPAYQVSESVREFMGDAIGGATSGSWCIRASNGPVNLELSSWCMDPADLDVILRAAADAACKTLAAMDPDLDGDVDVPGVGPHSDTDGDHGHGKETAASAGLDEWLQRGAATLTAAQAGLKAELAAVDAEMTEQAARTVAAVAKLTETAPAPVDAANAQTTPAEETEPEPEPEEDQAPEPAAATEQKEGSGMSETTNQTAAAPAPAETAPAAPGTITMTDAQFKALLESVRPAAAPVAEAAAPVQAAPVVAANVAQPAPAAPAAQTVTESTDDARLSALVEERLTAILAEKGYAAPVAETEEQRVAKIVEAKVTEKMQAMVANGEVTPVRAGLTAEGAVDEHRQPSTAGGEALHPETGLPVSWPGGGSKPLHQYSSEELAQFTGPVLDHHVMGRNAITTMR